MDISMGEGTQKRREGRRAEGAVKVGDQASMRERLKGEKDGVGAGAVGGTAKITDQMRGL